ncbi:hypothetical protein PT286_05470 [Neisseriaceae bacterium ESL0693]|nr:hypothetical protein [Neisseriaceae bacterium ESL0693]
MNKQKNRILKDLKLLSHAKIKVAHWDTGFRTELLHWLQQEGYDQCRFYRRANKKNHYIIALPDAYIPYQLVEEYKAPRSRRLLRLPIDSMLVLVLFTLLLTAYTHTLTITTIVMLIATLIGMLCAYCGNLHQPAAPATRVIIYAVMSGAALVLLSFVFEPILVLLGLLILLLIVMQLPLLGMFIMRWICRLWWKPVAKTY